MAYWKMMMAGGAALLISVGSARAGERVDGATASAQREMIRDVGGGSPSDLARARLDGTDADRSSYVTHGELEQHDQALIERLERERSSQSSTPRFTDAG